MRVVKQEFNARGGTVIIEADKMEDLDTTAARTLAITTAQAAGITKAGVSGDGGSYPVDAKGESGDDVLFGKTPTAAYRRDFKIAGGI